MTPSKEEVKAKLEDVLRGLDSRERTLAKHIRPILEANLQRNRIEYVIAGDLTRVDEYVHCVAENYRKLNGYLRELQVEKSDDAWEPLIERMGQWAFHFLMRSNFAPNASTKELTGEYATEAAMALLVSHFPYDTEFDPWAHNLVQNICRRKIREAMKKSNIPDSQTFSLDDLSRQISDALIGWDAELRELRAELLDSMEQLIDTRKQVILLHYFDGLPLPEIAKIMDKSQSAIYNLHFNALSDLREIFGRNRHKDE